MATPRIGSTRRGQNHTPARCERNLAGDSIRRTQFRPPSRSFRNRNEMCASRSAFAGVTKILNRAVGLRVTPRTSCQLAITHGAQYPAQSLPADDGAEFLEDPLAEIDNPPSHDAVNRRDRPALEDRRQ